MSQEIIFGKNDITNIVNIEVLDSQCILFREIEGKVIQEYIPNYYWIITPDKKYSNQHPLEGNQHYKYIARFDSEERLKAAKKKLGWKSDSYQIWNPKEAIMVAEGITYFKGMKINEVSRLSFDIESDGLKKTKNSEIYAITNTYINMGVREHKEFLLCDYSSQKEMLETWCSWVKEKDPSIIAGHNILMFDFPYLNHVAQLNDCSLSLGRDNSDILMDSRASKFRKDGSQEYEYHNVHIFGREVIDTWMLAIRYDIERKFESYGLKPIIKQLGLEKVGRSFIDASKIKQYYYNRHQDPETWNKVVKYAEEDSEDALKLYDIMAPSYFYFTQSVSKPFQMMILSATGSQVNNMMVRSYLQKGHSIAKAEEIEESIEGGISFAIPGLYKNVLKVDLKSAYPSQILRFKLYDPKKDPDAHFYKLVHYFTHQRFDLKKQYKETKDKYYYDREQSSKILINSAYGACTTPGLNYNCRWIGAKITEETRKVIDQALVWASGKGKDHWMSLFKEKTGQEEDESDEG